MMAIRSRAKFLFSFLKTIKVFCKIRLTMHRHRDNLSKYRKINVMKPQIIFLCLSVVVTSFAGFHQGEPPAEKVYKNIKTLTGTPAGELIPSMKFMSAALKVDCDFCHKADDFASDEKQAKIATRHMIEMQRDINTKNFNGRMQVTCNTCHNGSPNPQRAPLVAGISRRTIVRGGTPVPTADVLKKYNEGVGASPKAISLEGTATGLEAGKMTIKVTQGQPNKFRLEMGDRLMGYDGTATWFSANGQTQLLSGGAAVELQSYGRFFRGEHAFDSLGELRFAGRDKINGNEVVVLRAGAQNAKVSEDFYFDAKSGLLVRIASYTMTILGSMPEAVDFSDFRKVAGAMVPFKVTRTGPKESSVIQFDKSSENPAMDSALFSPPVKK